MGFHVGYPIVNAARYCQLSSVRNVPPPGAVCVARPSPTVHAWRLIRARTGL